MHDPHITTTFYRHSFIRVVRITYNIFVVSFLKIWMVSAWIYRKLTPTTTDDIHELKNITKQNKKRTVGLDIYILAIRFEKKIKWMKMKKNKRKLCVNRKPYRLHLITHCVFD